MTVVPPPPPPPNWVNVVVYNYPYDAPNHYISDGLKFFGKVQDVRYQHWTNLPEVATGTRVVRINLSRSIPRFMGVGGTWNCPTVCFKCRGNHASDSYPNRRRWENAHADEDDFQSVASDLGAGDDVSARPSDSNANSAEAASASASGTTDAPAAGGSTPGVTASDPPLASAAPQPSSAPDDDERLNQLDEIQTPVDSSSQSMLDGLSGAVHDACESATGALKSTGGSDGPSSDFPFAKPQDVDMSQSSLSQKRGTSELLSSDDSRRSRSRNRKSSRVAGPHVPSGVSQAVNLARSRSSP